MALQSTVYHLQIELSDVDRGVYEALDLRVARHPSESMAYLLTRTIAYALLYEEGIAFSRGGCPRQMSRRFPSAICRGT